MMAGVDCGAIEGLYGALHDGLMHDAKDEKRQSTHEKLVRDRVALLMASQGKNQRETADAASMDPSRFNRFFRGKGGVTLDEMFRLAEALGVPVRMIVSSESEPTKGPRPIPTLFLRNFPVGAHPAEVIEAMIQFRHRWEQTYREDPRAYAIELAEPFQDCLPGDVLIFSDSQAPKGRDVIVISKDGEAMLALAMAVNGSVVAMLKDGTASSDFTYRGRMIQLIRNR